MNMVDNHQKGGGEGIRWIINIEETVDKNDHPAKSLSRESPEPPVYDRS